MSSSLSSVKDSIFRTSMFSKNICSPILSSMFPRQLRAIKDSQPIVLFICKIISFEITLHFTGNTELIFPQAIERIIAYNKQLCLEKGKQFGFRREVLDAIIDSVNSQSDIVDSKARMARKAANLLSGFSSGFSSVLPFDSENVSTAMALILDYLESNGLHCPRGMAADLYQIVRTNLTSAKLRDKIESYLRKNLK